MKKIKTIIGKVERWEYLNEADVAGFIPRHQDLKTPYCAPPTHTVLKKLGTNFIITEPKHGAFEVYDIEDEQVYTNEIEATHALLERKYGK